MNKSRLFVASCISLVTTAMMFAIRGDIEAALSAAFHLSKMQMGVLWGPAFWGFTIGIFACGFLVDVLGMKVLHVASALGYIFGVLAFFVAPRPSGPVESVFSHPGTTILFVAFLAMGISQGLVEGVINPLVATLYSDQKTRRLNFLHAWWPGGMVIGGLAAFALTQAGVGWQIKLGLILLPAVVYLVLALRQTYPPTERVASAISTGTMMRAGLQPLFVLIWVCMWMTAATELGPNQWFPSLLKQLTGIEGILFLVYTAGLVWALRFFGSGLAHRLSPFALLAGSCAIAAVGLFWLGSLAPGSSPLIALVAATLFGVGTAYLWPTMLGITSERFPQGGALLMNIVGGTGMASIAIVLPQMGSAFEHKGPGAALQMVALLPVILTAVFAALYLGFRRAGGYRAVALPSAAGVAETVDPLAVSSGNANGVHKGASSELRA